MAPVGGGNIKVVVRVRPFNNREIDRKAKCIVQMKDSQTVLTPPPDAEERLKKGGGKAALEGTKTFAFDKSYWSFNRSDSHYAGQNNLFSDLGSPLLDNAFQGYNNCIFAYGQTGSGKSYSMMGYGEDAGVIPRICRNMFERIGEIQKDSNVQCTVEVSYLEIYNERVRDLLNPATKGNLKVREHPSTGPYVEDLAKLVVRSFQEIENLMDEGNKARTVAATNMNETSSRSHAVFTLTLSQKRHDVETNMDTEKVAKISLVDLAGSERATSTGATGARLKEGAEINRSLSTLGRVIAALADLSSGKKKNASMVPYRDSVLTWLLKDSLGGNSMTAMIAAISPADINFEETLSTLRYADSAKRIKNHAVVNEDPNARMIRELKEELAQLRSKLGAGGAGGIGGEIGSEAYPPDTPLEKQMVSISQADGSVKKVSKAEIVEQLNQSEKLYKDLNQTWEEKLQKTEEIHKEREAALEELGISIEKGFIGLTTPKKMPHLVNLSDDPLLAECLVYNLKPGMTHVGNVAVDGNEKRCEIRLNGSRILPQHCSFENTDNIVSIIPSEGAAVMVNGLRIDKPKRLRSGNRIILGDFHIFRFNHPQEARAERAEQSLLRHSVTASQLGSPAPGRPIHERSTSKAGSEFGDDFSRPDSPSVLNRGRDSDWSYARREAASAILGSDQKISHLTDDELDNLFEDVQRAREKRRRNESKLFDNEEDSDSLASFLVRDKYMSNGTIDNFSMDTALTLPGTPQQTDGGDSSEEMSALEAVRDDMQRQLNGQKEEYAEKLRAAEVPTSGVETLKQEKERMEQALRAAKEEFEEQLRRQKEAFDEELKELKLTPQRPRPQPLPHELTEREKSIAKTVLDRWSQRNFVRIAESMLQNAALLKEAQVMSHVMDKNVIFQYAIIDRAQYRLSSYDLVLNDISGYDDDLALEQSKKPSLGVRVVDYRHSVIYLWSIEKLRHRLQKMRQMHQYLDRPEYIQHFRLDNPFCEPSQPRFSFIGDANVPLAAVFESRVQDFAVEIISPYTLGVVGVVKLSLEPSSAVAPSSTIKFNVVMHDMVGFAEREGTLVHAQLSVLNTIDPDEDGVTSTQMIDDFDEGPVRFESVHSMSLPQSSPRESYLKVAIYAQVTSMHLDKLLSWDEIRESTGETDTRKGPRVPESEYHSEERHDIFARIQILELAENGQYLPVEVVQASEADVGAYQLHQGLQRRVVVSLTHSSTESFPWDDLNNLRVGDVHLVDSMGKITDLDAFTPDIALKQIQEPMIKDSPDGTSTITIIGQWDSSLHNSLLLDRTTSDKNKIQISLAWDILSPRIEQTMTFRLRQQLQILPRSYSRPQSILKSFWNQTRVLHSTDGIFSVAIRPISAKKAADLWRMDTEQDYVNGEELLEHWRPRRVTLVRDFIESRRRRQRLADLETTKGAMGIRNLSLSSRVTSPTPSVRSSDLNEKESELLKKFLHLWTTPKQDISDYILHLHHPHSPSNEPTTPHLPPPTNDGIDSVQSSPSKLPVGKPRYLATVSHVPRHPISLKSGQLLMPSERQDPSQPNMQWFPGHLRSSLYTNLPTRRITILPIMVLEATMIIVDNSESSRNGDYLPSRFGAQTEAVNIIFSAKTQANPESSVGLMSMGGRGPEVLVTLTTDMGKILEGLHRTKISGDSHLSTAIQVAGLALKHRQNKSQRQRIIVFTCSPIDEDEKSLVKLAKRMKKNNVSIDFVAFGDLEPETTQKLEAFSENVKGGDGSHLAVIPPGPNLLSDNLVTTPILAGEGVAGPRGGEGGMEGDTNTGGFEFGVDPSMDPELAMALRMSFEEEQNRLEKQRREQEEQEKKSKLEGIPEEGQPSQNGEGSGSGGPGSADRDQSKPDQKDDDKMDTA
ncbi:putative kinesin family protein [Phaeomoniella chlamydospora]|uniref:Kinesin-like protein unc-104 n=1 Tax=Phaeomoniella chlamydospora TaxID=158046 RepID=A0A0G2DU38_PHACM|nr:putative kinesin family protein [Phaeomoniella chlamydospora]